MPPYSDLAEFAHSPFIGFFVFVIGLCVGSFLNVAIYRIPLNVSIVHPGSHCAACGAPIPWYHNIPVLSWWILRGRAACCGTRIDWRYWMVEALTGVLFLALYNRYPFPEFVCYAIFCCGLIASTCIDMDHFIIPDRFTLGGCLAGFVCCTLVPSLQGKTTAWAGFTESLRGAFVAGLVLLIIAKVGTWIFRKDAMGMGDVKFIAAMGAFLGASSITFIIPVSAFIGSAFGIGILFGKQGSWGTRTPYGPFLAAAAGIWLFGGHEYTTAQWQHVLETLSPPTIDPNIGGGFGH